MSVKIALLGCGGIQGKHTRTFIDRDDAQIVGLCDVTDAAIEAFLGRADFREHLSDVPRFADAATMYDAIDADAVCICTPHTQHYQQAKAALDAGLHVLLEKPMVTDAGDGHQLAEQIKASGKVLIVGYNTPCSPQMAYIRDVIRSGELGKLELCSGWLSQGWLKGTTGKWRQDPAMSGGGQAYDSGSHPLASLFWTVDSRVDAVHCFLDNVGSPVDINSVINIRFRSGVLASMTIGGNCPKNGADMVYMFDGGQIVFDPWSPGRLDVWKGKNKLEDVPLPGEKTEPADNFLDSIQGKDQPRVGADLGVALSELMDAIYVSAESGKAERPARTGSAT
jgi:predicted dehydrogenase